MSLPAAISGNPSDPLRETRNLLLLLWAVAVFSLYWASGINSLSTDDAMRLVEVRDLLAGQSWFDMTQYRLNPPAGVVTHWSRLVDLPLALMIRSAALFAPAAAAENMALIMWPTALLLVFLAGVSRLARELAGHSAARMALILAVLMAPVLQNFRTGSIHHHNVQLVLTVWELAFLARAPLRARAGAAAGFLGALSVAVGQQMVPAVAMLAAAVAVRWIVEGDGCRRTTTAYAVLLAAGAIVLAVATIPPADYFAVHCDAISIAQVGALVIGGFGLAALATLRRLNSIADRAVAAAGIAATLAVFIKIGAPQCIGDPYAQLDPRVAGLWLSSVAEARSLASMMRDLPQQVPAYFGIPLAALVLGAIRCIREEGQQRWNWIYCIGVQAAFLLVAVWEVRGASGANALGAVLVPAALMRMLPASQGRAAYFGVPRAALVVMLVLNPVTLLALGSGVAHAVQAAGVTPPRIVDSGDAGTCQRAADYAPLATLPRGRVLAFIDSGPFILMASEHAVLAAPYHRNQAGNIAMFDMFLAPPEQAQRRIEAHGIDYVAFCPGAPERYNYAAAAPASLVAALSRNEIPGFLERIPFAGTDLAVYRVRK
jgi:hypothetical protein